MFFYASKIFQLFGRPDSLALIAICVGAVLLWTRWKAWGRWLLTAVALAVLIITTFPVGDWLGAPLERRFPIVTRLPEHIDGIVTMGGIDAEFTIHYGQPALNRAAERLTTALALARRYPDAKIVFTGGSGSLFHQELRSADAARLFFDEQGLDMSKLILEREARGTHEQAVLTKALVNPQPGETWLLITSALQLPRTVNVFRSVGWNVVPYPVDFRYLPGTGPRLGFYMARSLENLWSAMKEWLGLVAYRFTGRTGRLLPAAP